MLMKKKHLFQIPTDPSTASKKNTNPEPSISKAPYISEKYFKRSPKKLPSFSIASKTLSKLGNITSKTPREVSKQKPNKKQLSKSLPKANKPKEELSKTNLHQSMSKKDQKGQKEGQKVILQRPPSPETLLAREQIKLTHGGDVFNKYLASSEDPSRAYKIQLLDNIVEARQKLNNNDKFEEYRKNYFVINDFYSKLKRKVDIRRRTQRENTEREQKMKLQFKDTQKEEEEHPVSSESCVQDDSENNEKPEVKPKTLLKPERSFPLKAPSNRVISETEVQPLRTFKRNLTQRPLIRKGTLLRAPTFVETEEEPKESQNIIPGYNKMKGDSKFCMQVRLAMKIIKKKEMPTSLKRIKTMAAGPDDNLEEIDSTPLLRGKKKFENIRLREKLKKIELSKSLQEAKEKKAREYSIKKIRGLSVRKENLVPKTMTGDHTLNQTYQCKYMEYGIIKEIRTEAKKELATHIQNIYNSQNPNTDRSMYRRQPSEARLLGLPKSSAPNGRSYPLGLGSAIIEPSHWKNCTADVRELLDYIIFSESMQGTERDKYYNRAGKGKKRPEKSLRGCFHQKSFPSQEDEDSYFQEDSLSADQVKLRDSFDKLQLLNSWIDNGDLSAEQREEFVNYSKQVKKNIENKLSGRAIN